MLLSLTLNLQQMVNSEYYSEEPFIMIGSSNSHKYLVETFKISNHYIVVFLYAIDEERHPS